MFEEAGERDLEQSHPSLLRKLALALGASAEEVRNAKPLLETSEYLERLFSLCRSSDYLEGLAAIGYGNEYLVLFEYPIFRTACKRIGCSSEVLKFFDVNIQADVEHTDSIERVITQALPDPSHEESLLGATEAALAARRTFYDGLCRVTKVAV
jgi:pyrroloquinoline quinone (PQQ) biosynthesis protein C